MSSPFQQAESRLAQRFEALIRVSQAIGAHRDPKQLFAALAIELHRVVDFDGLVIARYDKATGKMSWHSLEISGRPGVTFPPDFPAEETISKWVYDHQQPLVISSIEQEMRFPRMTEFLRKEGIQSLCSLPLTTVHRRLGSIGVGSRHPQAYCAEEVRFLSLVADQVALAIDDALNLQELEQEKERLRLLLDLNNTVVSNLELRELLRTISGSVRRLMRCDAVSVLLPKSGGSQLRAYAVDFPGSKGYLHEGTLVPIEGSLPGRIFLSGQPWTGAKSEVHDLEPETNPGAAEGFRFGCLVPLISHNRVLGVIGLGRLEAIPFSKEDVEFLGQLGGQIAIALENALAYREIADLKDRLAQEKLYLEDEIRSELNFEEIVGTSAALRRVLQQVETVAPTESTVLIYGETGTGKELIARAIHDRSSRRQNAFVKLNCAAIPTGLLESELFGHEKGAFTGAVNQRIGRFELANHGSVFLDEIGEIPLELQPKLLRVLQEREFERLGSSRTLQTDARLIAATNRDLSAMVREQKFRADLFYRLNVFPVEVPPLRERPEDIPLLVRHFVEQFSRRMNKTVDTIPSETMSAMVRYHWPGNIRELQNLIERAVILSQGPVLKVPVAELKADPTLAATRQIETLEDGDRRHILAALNATNWVVGGPKGAAALLDLKRSTLQARMEKLGIRRPHAVK
jgi:formate hydrogenlyase transcriptional activator